MPAECGTQIKAARQGPTVPQCNDEMVLKANAVHQAIVTVFEGFRSDLDTKSQMQSQVHYQMHQRHSELVEFVDASCNYGGTLSVVHVSLPAEGWLAGRIVCCRILFSAAS